MGVSMTSQGVSRSFRGLGVLGVYQEFPRGFRGLLAGLNRISEDFRGFRNSQVVPCSKLYSNFYHYRRHQGRNAFTGMANIAYYRHTLHSQGTMFVS